ncbi:hypothetical protein GCM10008965_45690 [Methylorubrum aminovorans]|nr:hypothetical protein [Methylorubrum aminovorans]GMA80165.1 hypothetical protein GCM10025880_65820 [Methylorubrum aminovorans]
MRSRLLACTAAALLGSFALYGSAVAAPGTSVPRAGLNPGLSLVRMTRGETMHHRMPRGHRMRPRRMGDPNARNPSRPGYQQQKGNTSGGPRY